MARFAQSVEGPLHYVRHLLPIEMGSHRQGALQIAEGTMTMLHHSSPGIRQPAPVGRVPPAQLTGHAVRARQVEPT